MIALELTNIKEFMNVLLKSEVFDHFLLSEAVIVNGATHIIDGHIAPGFYTEEEASILGIEGYSILPYSQLRNNCLEIIKGKKTPASFKFILQLSPSNLERTINACGSSFTTNDVTGVFINIKYQNQLLTLTTGVSYSIFSPDKSLENYWDKSIQKFLYQNNIAYEEL